MPESPANQSRQAIPKRAGVGLKAEHYRTIMETSPDIGFFEIHAENYMGAGGPPHRYLSEIRERYPLSLHGVGLSIGADRPLDKDHLDRFRNLIDRYSPALFSEHLAWSSHDVGFLNDLLPLPYTNETLARVVEHIDEVQETLRRQMLLENPSTYLAFEESTWAEADFIAEIVRRTGCGLLLDVNNVHVACTNQQWNPVAYLDAYPLSHVQEIHLAGFAPDADDEGRPLLIDAHDRCVEEIVWGLFARIVERIGPVPALIEWDANVPDWPTLYDEARKADAILGEAGKHRVRPRHLPSRIPPGDERRAPTVDRRDVLSAILVPVLAGASSPAIAALSSPSRSRRPETRNMIGRKVAIYFAWDKTAEVSAPLAVIEDRFPALFESRRMLYPRFEELSDTSRFDQGIAGFLDHIMKQNFAEFVWISESKTGQPGVELERVDAGGRLIPLSPESIKGADTLIIISFDSLRTHQQASHDEIAFMRAFLSDPDHLVFVGPHHDIGEEKPETHEELVALQVADFLHHGDKTIPPRQGFGGFARTLLTGLGVPVENRFGLHPASEPDGSPSPVETDRSLDRLHLLVNVPTFNLHPHLPHFERMGHAVSRLEVLSRQKIDLAAPPHPFTADGRTTFDALLQSKPDAFAGTLLVGDATLWSSTAGGVDSLKAFWSNIVQRPRREDRS